MEEDNRERYGRIKKRKYREGGEETENEGRRDKKEGRKEGEGREEV